MRLPPGISRLPIFDNALELFVQLVLSMIAALFFNSHPWLVILAWAAIFGWPWVIRFLAQSEKSITVWSRTKGGLHSAGKRYCPGCGATLDPIMEEGLPLAECHVCQGVWCDSKVLAGYFKTKNKSMPAWGATKTEDGGEQHPCPVCLKDIQEGNFIGAKYNTAYCAPCDGFWMNRVDWVSLKLSLD